MTKFSTDSSGTASGGHLWNTLGGDGVWNLYVIQGPAGGPFVNTGDGPSTSINIPLATGTHTFTLHGDYSAVTWSHMGLNLFFAGDNTNPRISVFGANGVLGGTRTGNTTYTLAGALTPGANAVSCITAGYRVTLSNFLYRAAVTGSDRVSSHDSVPDGVDDNLITFTLAVEPFEPVPALTATGIGLLGLLIAGAALVALRRLG
jgi:hypothetical protein